MIRSKVSMRWTAGAFLAAICSLPALAAPAAPKAWVAKSDQNAQVLLDVIARQSPEGAGQLGISGLDEQIFDLSPGFVERGIADTEKAVATLKERLVAEKDPDVRQDLAILIQAAEQNIEGARLSDKYQVPFFDLNQAVFQGLRGLLDDQVEPARRAAALVRLKKYTGMAPGTTPITRLAEDFIRSREKPGLLYPFKDEVEKNLGNGTTYIDGIGPLFEKYKLAGYQEPYARLKQQMAAYNDFVRKEILPKARSDFRQPPELYAFALKQVGVDMPVAELVSRAEVAFREIQNEMQALAPLVAKQKGWNLTDYKDVIRELHKQQVVGEAILPLYQQRIKDMEEIIRSQHIVTLPDRPMKVRLASAAESAQTPAPNMKPPRFIGNTGETGEFVLPLRIPGQGGKGSLALDDFTFDAISWTLTAHEGRPGHELQFSAMVEKGVSKARAIFGLNSVNVEGWALYAEAEAKPYEPLDGQLGALQARLQRAARAILDPGLQQGTITREEATRVLREEVVLSEGMALQEIERYTFWAPGQATAYFCGYTRLMELRAEVERILGKRFDRQRYHDFLIAQGPLPPTLLRKAVYEQFLPQEKGRG
ncbi:MAG TPA: DUF885 domain-containing protein [Thermoanaerobaculia bacterium]|nr:DUF885 domain-containing protein [Thermoanaerobaculia bacterium]